MVPCTIQAIGQKVQSQQIITEDFCPHVYAEPLLRFPQDTCMGILHLPHVCLWLLRIPSQVKLALSENKIVVGN